MADKTQAQCDLESWALLNGAGLTTTVSEADYRAQFTAPTIRPDLSPLAGSLADISTTLAMLCRHTQHHAGDMDAAALRHWERQLGRIDDAVKALHCDRCERELISRQYFDELLCAGCFETRQAQDGEA